MENTVTWQTLKGETVVVTVLSSRTYSVSVDGVTVSHVATFQPVPPEARTKARQLGVVAFLGRVAVTAERKEAIEALAANLFPLVAPIPADLMRLEDKLEAARAWVRRHDENPAPAYAALRQAEAELANWVATHPDEYAAVAQQRHAEAEARKKELRDSFIARGLD